MNPSCKKSGESNPGTPFLDRGVYASHQNKTGSSPHDRPQDSKEEIRIYYRPERDVKPKAKEHDGNERSYISSISTRPLPPLPLPTDHDPGKPKPTQLKVVENKENTTFSRSLGKQKFGIEYDVHDAATEGKDTRRASNKLPEEGRVDASSTSLAVSDSSLDSLANAEILTATTIKIKKVSLADIKVPKVIREEERKKEEEPKQRVVPRREPEDRTEFGYMLNIPKQRESEHKASRSKQDERPRKYTYREIYAQQHGQVYGRGYDQIGSLRQTSLQLPPSSSKKPEKENDQQQQKTTKGLNFGPYERARASFGRRQPKPRFPLESDTEDETTNELNRTTVASASSRDVGSSDRTVDVANTAAENTTKKQDEPIEKKHRAEPELSPVKHRGQRHPYSPSRPPMQNKSPERTRPVAYYYYRGGVGYTGERNKSPTPGGASSRGARRSSAPPPRHSSYGERLTVPTRPQHDLRRARYGNGSPLRAAASTGTLRPNLSIFPTSPSRPSVPKVEAEEMIEKKKTSKLKEFFKKF
ncbi:hypothetical protein AA313_de0203782 [Arthrobotrys entomopaga]|nr:hypothetical protein AA313_de0203782 [Arthrobotrys entomopaga]